MIVLAILIPLLVVALIVGAFMVGCREGSHHWQTLMDDTRRQSANAERQLHDLTRQAFVAMAEEVERHRRGDRS